MTDRIGKLPRCCPKHDDWPTLVEHLRRDFPGIEEEQLLRSVLEAQRVTDSFDVHDDEALEVAELMVRYRLLLSTGEIPDVARTDPQTHHVGGSDTDATSSEHAPTRTEV
ncbi:MAG TPA: hypothetical protein VHE57_07915 [Mycobacteriales bacterium]|nr:hypothetical protein [Mycobacteriales bacterium]